MFTCSNHNSVTLRHEIIITEINTFSCSRQNPASEITKFTFYKRRHLDKQHAKSFEQKLYIYLNRGDEIWTIL